VSCDYRGVLYYVPVLEELFVVDGELILLMVVNKMLHFV
jgi:hypothetical protein